MVIIGFVVTVMIFSSFAIVFSNSGNNKNTSNKQILNIPEKSFTSNVVNKYQIDLSNLPSGNGYYQQLITLNNYDTYGINSNGSNIEFFSSNNTQLYAWIQSINSTSMQIWIKNFNQSSIMYLYVLQSYENLFSSKGYLGEAPQLSTTYAKYDNGKYVFTAYFNGLTPLSDFVQYYPADTSITRTVQSFSGVDAYTINNSRNNSFSGSVLIPEFALNVSIPNGNLIVQSSTYLEENSTADEPRIALLNSLSYSTSLDAIAVDSGWNDAYFQEQNISNGNGNYDINQYGTESIGWQYGEINYTVGSSTYSGSLSPNPNSLSRGHSAIANNSIGKGGNLYIGAIGGINVAYTILQNSMFFNYVFAASLGSVSSMPTYTINQILNLQSGISKTVSISNGKNDANSPIEFYANFMLYVNASNDLIIENLTNSQTVNTGLTYNTTYDSNYYGLIVYESYLYVYLIKAVADSGINYGICIYLDRYTIDGFTLENTYKYNAVGIEGGNEVLGLFGITANTNGIYAFIGYDDSGICYPIFMHLSYTDTEISFNAYTNLTITDTDYSGIVMGNFYEFNTNGNNYLVNLNYLTLYSLGNSLANWYGEIIYNNTYENNFSTLTASNENNIYISNYINYGCYYNIYLKTSNPEPQIYNNRREANTSDAEVSFINENFYNNAYVNFTGYLKYNNSYAVKLGSYTLPYTILNNSIYYAINSYTYGIAYLNTYILNITSYNHDSYQLKDYFYYNDNIYSGLQFNFTNDNGIFSILPLNYSVYVYNGSYITTSSSEFKSIGNGIYEYNLSIYYGQLTTNTTSSIKPLDISSYIYPIGIIIFVSFLGAMVYFSKNEGKK